jgi:Do/DeqQ family serine protease
MKSLRHVILFLFITLPLFASAHVPIMMTSNGTPSLAPMLSKVTPAVVNITVEKTVPAAGANNPFAPPAAKKPPLRGVAVGSGVIFDAKHGLIVTNAHVVQNEHVMLVTLKDGRHFRAKLVGKDNGFDIAVIRIPPHKLTALPFGDSDKLKVGNFVAAIGSPFGLTQTVTSGVISALNRSHPQLEGFQSFIQTDAPINPGNSGGALVSMDGKLIGINTAIITPVDANIGIGFSIPSNMVHSVIVQLLKYGKVERGMLGVIAQNITPELADAMHLKTTKGTLVSTVAPGSPASHAGLESQDIITQIDGKPVRSAAQLRNTLGLMRPGTTVHLTLLRNHVEKSVSAKIGDPKKFVPPHVNPFLAGLRMQKFSELEGDGTHLNGVLITNMTDTSSGSLSGLIPGDVITMANNKPVKSISDLIKQADAVKDELLVKVYRGTSSIYLVMQP